MEWGWPQWFVAVWLFMVFMAEVWTICNGRAKFFGALVALSLMATVVYSLNVGGFF